MSDTANTQELKEPIHVEQITLTDYLENVRVIFFNGPPQSGKDTAKDIATEFLEDLSDNSGQPIAIFHVKLSKMLKLKVHEFLGLKNKKGLPLAHDAFEADKDVRLKEFYGITPRQAYINISELFAKPTWGKHIWCSLLWDQELEPALRRTFELSSSTITYVLVSDLGFDEELEFFKTKFAPEQLAIARIQREGKSYETDSRKFVFGNFGARMLETNLWNNKSVDDFKGAVCDFLRTVMATDPINSKIRKLVGAE